MQSTHRKLVTGVAATLCGLVTASSLHAATVAHYRFEGDDFLKDSAGSNHLTEHGTITQYELPETGPGSNFPNPIPQMGAANVHALQVGGNGRVSAAPDAFTGLTNFTFEVFFNLAASSTDTQYLGGQSSGSGNNRSWAIGVASSGGTGDAVPNELFGLLSANGATNKIVPLGLVVTPGKDYYVAFTFNGSTDTDDIQVFSQNLTDGGPLTVTTISSTITTLHSSTARFDIAAYASGNGPFNGIIDEVRVSNTILTESELLSVIPEPASLSLLGLGAMGLLRRRRTTC